MIVVVVVVVVLGLVGWAVGSLLNVVIACVPDGRRLSLSPACPSCGSTIRRRDRVTGCSWLPRRGSCRTCSAAIPAQYAWVEICTALLWAVLAAWALVTDGALPLLPVMLVLGSAGIALAFIDLNHHRLPDAIVLPLYPVTALGLIVAGVISGRWFIVAALVGAGVWVVVVGVPWLVSGGRGMGFGDVKLAPVLGAALGWWSVSAAVVGLLLTFLLGALVGLALMAARRAGRRTHLPFGPYLLLGALLGLLIGPAVGIVYVDSLAGA